MSVKFIEGFVVPPLDQILRPGEAENDVLSQVAPTISVIVPHYQDLAALDRCLQAIQGQTLDNSQFEVIVADNNSPIGPQAVKNCINNRARLVIVEKKGAGMARNGGASVAKGKILAFTDSDCIPEADWLAEGVKLLSDYDLVGGRMTVLVDNPMSMTSAEAFERIFAFNNEHYVKKLGFTVTANLICQKKIFEVVGEFLGADVAEDTEWCQRARAAGFKIGYAPKSIVGHPARKSWADLLKKWRRVNTDNFGLAVRAKGGRIKWFLRTILMPISALVHTPKAIFGAGVTTLSQRLAALGVLYRLRFWRMGHAMQLLLRRSA